MDVRERLLSGRFVRGVAGETIRVFVVGGGCGQEEPGIIMLVKLATGSTVVEKTGNCPHESKIKASFANRDRIRLITH